MGVAFSALYVQNAAFQNGALVQNAAHKVIYKNVYQKLDDLLKHRVSFNDERAGLYRTAINAYSHDHDVSL